MYISFLSIIPIQIKRSGFYIIWVEKPLFGVSNFMTYILKKTGGTYIYV